MKKNSKHPRKKRNGKNKKVVRKHIKRAARAKHNCLACVIEEITKGDPSRMPSMAELLERYPVLVRDHLLGPYYTLFLFTCRGEATAEKEDEIKLWIHNWGEGQAERVIDAANKQWAETAPTLWKIFTEGTERERAVVDRIQIERHERGQCDLCRRYGANRPLSATLIERDLPKLEALVTAAMHGMSDVVANAEDRVARKPWELLLEPANTVLPFPVPAAVSEDAGRSEIDE